MGFYTTERENLNYYSHYSHKNTSKFARRYSLAILKDTYFLKYAYRRIQFILEQKIGHNSVVLDLGAGTGLYGELLQQLRPDLKIISCDLSYGFLKINRSPFKFQNDSKQIPLKDASVDYVICFEVFHHLPHLESTLDEIKRIVRKGIFVNEVNSNSPLCLVWHLLQKDERRLLQNNYFKLMGELKKRFEIVYFKYFEFIPYFKPILNRFTFPFLYRVIEYFTTLPLIKYFSGNYFVYCKKYKGDI